MKEAAKSSFNVISVWPQDESNVAGRVILSNVTVDAEGTYKCEVSTEAPIFDTDSKESNLTVISKLRMLPADASGGCFRRKRVTHFICFFLGVKGEKGSIKRPGYAVRVGYSVERYSVKGNDGITLATIY